MSISVNVVPHPGQWPETGGVREHLSQLFHQIGLSHDVAFTGISHAADVIHVESAYAAPKGFNPDVYVCHGGFLPKPIPVVLSNLSQAKIIVSVAKWIVPKFFPQHAHKTVHIPTGILLEEWEDLPPSGIEPGYVLFAKEVPRLMDDFIRLAELMPKQKFVSLVWPDGMSQLANVEVIGLQGRESIRSVIKDAGVLMMTGDEVCPIMLREAWACGTPIIARDGTGAEEIMLRGHSVHGGILYGDGLASSAHEIEHLKFWVRELVYNGRTYAAYGHDLIVAEYQWGDLFAQYVEVYEAIDQDRVEEFLAQKALQRPTEGYS